MGNSKTGKAQAGNGDSPADEKFSLISDAKLISMYKHLLRSSASGGNGSHAAVGAVVGTAIDLGPGDVVCSLDHHLLVPLSRADAVEQVLAVPNGKNGASPEKNGVRPSPFAHAVIGTALANKTARNGKIALVYCANGNTECLREAIHIATIHALPMVFVNHTTSRARAAERAKRTFAEPTPWFPSITVDIHDVVAVYRVANESISRARLGRGPTVIECRTYSLGASANGNGLHSHDPIVNMEKYLHAKGLLAKASRTASTETRLR